MKSIHKEAALKILINTANKHNCSPKEAIKEALWHCDEMIKFHTDNAPMANVGYVEYWTKYYTKVKQWLSREDLTSF